MRDVRSTARRGPRPRSAIRTVPAVLEFAGGVTLVELLYISAISPDGLPGVGLSRAAGVALITVTALTGLGLYILGRLTAIDRGRGRRAARLLTLSASLACAWGLTGGALWFFAHRPGGPAAARSLDDEPGYEQEGSSPLWGPAIALLAAAVVGVRRATMQVVEDQDQPGGGEGLEDQPAEGAEEQIPL